MTRHSVSDYHPQHLIITKHKFLGVVLGVERDHLEQTASHFLFIHNHSRSQVQMSRHLTLYSSHLQQIFIFHKSFNLQTKPVIPSLCGLSNLDGEKQVSRILGILATSSHFFAQKEQTHFPIVCNQLQSQVILFLWTLTMVSPHRSRRQVKPRL